MASVTPQSIPALIEAAVSGKGPSRLAAVKELQQRGERAPGKLMPYAEAFVRMLDDGNSIVRWNALLTVGHLAGAENGNTLEPLLERLLAPVAGPRLIDANCAMRAATAMAAAKPQFAERVAARLMETERGEYATPECRNVAIGQALDCLARLMPALPDRQAALAFAARHAENPRPATRKRSMRLIATASGRTSHEIHRATFGSRMPRRRTIAEMDAGIRQAVRERHGSR